MALLFFMSILRIMFMRLFVVINSTQTSDRILVGLTLPIFMGRRL